MMTEIRKAGARDETDVSSSDHCDAHRRPLSVWNLLGLPAVIGRLPRSAKCCETKRLFVGAASAD
jgi:hypothetical protein